MIRRLRSRADVTQQDRYFLINNVSWEQYRKVRAALDHVSNLRMTYLDGTLELMGPSRRREEIKTLVARLVELFALERGIDLWGYGSTTFRRKAKLRGLEPDECWCVGAEMGRFPQIAFEVVITSSAIDKLLVYHGLGVPEVWIWEDEKLVIHRRTRKSYVARSRSRFLPELDLARVTALVNSDRSEPAAVRAFRDELRAR